VLSLVLTLSMLLQAPSTQPAEDTAAAPVVDAVIKAAGGEVWPTVKRLQFTFNVEDAGKLVVSRRHDWDLRAGTDVVTDLVKKADPVTVDLSKKEPAAQFQQWTNDSYWLLMPLKLKDGGVKFSALTTTRDYPPSRASVTMSFDSVGLTPGDQYRLSIDLRQNRITHWVYMPNPQTQRGFTWDDYQDFNGVVLSTTHKEDDTNRRIFFTDVKVER
jgi:hypothetical protein